MDESRKSKVSDESQRGHAAQRILNDPIFKDAMAAVKQEVIDRWAAAPARDTEGREWLWQHYQVALKFEEVFSTMINTGKMADIEREQTATDKVRKFFAQR